jgi:hypothetical protein
MEALSESDLSGMVAVWVVALVQKGAPTERHSSIPWDVSVTVRV